MTTVGFTGSRLGMTKKQVYELRKYLKKLQPKVFLHGACVGCDEQAVMDLSQQEVVPWIVAYPGVSRARGESHHRSKIAITLSNEVMPEAGYFTRNKFIVSRADIVVGVTNFLRYEEPEWGTGGGTWQTLQFAAQVKKPHVIVWVDGEVEERNFTT